MPPKRAPRRSAPPADPGGMPPGFPPSGSAGFPPNTERAAPGQVLPPRNARDASGRLFPGSRSTAADAALAPVVEDWELAEELGATGLRQWSGIVREELLPKLQGSQEILTYREMSDNDPIVSASLNVMDLMARRTQWRVDPAGSDPQDLRAAAFLESVRHDMAQTWPDHISEALTMMPFGWSLFEIVYKLRHGQTDDPHTSSRFDDGLVGVRKLAVRAQDTLFRWQFDGTGGIQAMIQRPPPDYRERVVPIDKALLYRTAMRKNNPQGRSVLRGAYRAWFLKKRIEEFQAVGIERDLAGLPMALVPPILLSSAASPDQKALLALIKKIVTNVRNDEQAGIVFPLAYDTGGHQLYDFKLLTSGGRRVFDTSQVLEYYDQRIAMSMMTDFLFLGMSGARQARGSFNLGESKMDSFSAALGAYLDAIENVLNRYLVPRLFAMNGWKLDHLPEFKHEPVQNPNLAELGGFIKVLADAGMPMFPDEGLETYLRRIASLPSAPAPETSGEADAHLQPEGDVSDTSDDSQGKDEAAPLARGRPAGKPAAPVAGLGAAARGLSA